MCSNRTPTCMYTRLYLWLYLLLTGPDNILVCKYMLQAHNAKTAILCTCFSVVEEDKSIVAIAS